MAETGQDFVMWAGDDADIHVSLLGADGLPLDVTGCHLIWSLGESDPAPAVLEKSSSVASEIEVVDAIGGQIIVHLDPPDTLSLAGNFRHELEIRDAFAAIETIMVGWTTIHPAHIHPAASRRSLRVVGGE